MSTVKAFVGHSFTPEDAEIVQKFTNYLDTISELNIGFSWINAKFAEPILVSTKVVELMKDNNTFIGICTKKERVVSDNKLTKKFWSQKRLSGKSSDFEWKTSDWVIQEIGLALGMELKIILLIETGVRKPGSIQDNLEYIEFDRSFPEESFNSLLQMIRSLSPQILLSTGASSERTITASGTSKDKLDIKPEHLKPKKSWSRLDYEYALFSAFHSDKPPILKAIIDSYRKTDEYKSSEDGNGWDATIEFTRFLTDKSPSLDRLKDIVKVRPKDARSHTSLARTYSFLKLHSDSARTFELAASLFEDPKQKIKMHLNAAEEYSLAGDENSSDKMIFATRVGLVSEPTQEFKMLNVFKNNEKIISDVDLRIAAMERMLELNSQDDSVRFDLAYAYSQNSKNELALQHYKLIHSSNRSGIAWNNMGVAYGNLGMPVKAISSFQLAAEKGDTLARSNLAQKYLSAGFVKEAKSQIDEAMKIEDYHKNVASSLSRIKEIGDEETAKEKEIEGKIDSRNEFYKIVGHALTLVPIDSIAGLWKGPDCQIAITQNGNNFVAVGSYQVPESNLLKYALMGPENAPTSASIVQYNIQYKGTVYGSAGKGSYTRSKVGESKSPVTSILGRFDETKFIMYITEDGQQIKLMELGVGVNSKVQLLERMFAQTK